VKQCRLVIAFLVGPVGCLCMLEFILASFVGVTILMHSLTLDMAYVRQQSVFEVF
jgi:hypothetical protein